MSGQAKLTLLMQLKNKLFNNKLMQSKRKFTKTTDTMRGKMNRLRVDTVKGFKAMRDELPMFGRAMDMLGNPYVLITAGLLAVTMLFGKATIEAKKFNHEFLQVQNMNLDKSEAAIKKYKGDIRQAAFETGKSLVDTTKAYYDLQSATGIYGDKATAVYKKVAKFSTATSSQVGDNINATTKAMKAFGLGVNDIDGYLASNAKTVQVGIVTFQQLANVQTEYAGAAAGAGQSVDTANKIFAAFTSIAKDSRTAATMTKTAFMGLTQASTIKGLQDIGIKMYDAKGNMRDLGGVLNDVTAKFKKMSPKQIDELINKIGGPEGLRALFTKLKTGANDFHDTLNKFDSSKFDIDKAYKNAMNTFNVQSERFKNNANNLLARLGQVILPTITNVLKGLNNALVWMNDNWTDISDIIFAVGMGFSVLIGRMIWFEAVAIASSIASVGLSGAMFMVETALIGIKVAIYNIPIIGWIMLAVAGMALLYRKTEGWQKQWESLKTYFSIIFEVLKLQWNSVVNDFMSGINKIKIGFYKFKNAMGIGDKTANNKAIERINADTEARKKAIIDGQKAVTFLKGKATENLKWEIGWKKKTKTKDLLDEDGNPVKGDGTGTGTGEGAGAGDQINKVTGNASTPRTIIIENIEMNRGGINTTNTTLANMNKEEIQEWFDEMMMRTIRGIELSYG